MTEIITKEQLKAEKDKEAISAMKAAKQHMQVALDMQVALERIDELESCARNFAKLVDAMIEHIPDRTYPYEGRTSFRDSFKNRKLELFGRI